MTSNEDPHVDNKMKSQLEDLEKRRELLKAKIDRFTQERLWMILILGWPFYCMYEWFVDRNRPT
jgi:hypothetical protein